MAGPGSHLRDTPPLGDLLSEANGEQLVRIAGAAVRSRLCGAPIDGRPPTAGVLRRVGSSFVTLRRAGALRGCIGSLEPSRPLYLDVARNARNAMADPRMSPVGPDEWPMLEVHVSVLGRSEPMRVRSLGELCRVLRPTVDGLILAVGTRQATFLPAVWEQLPDPADFVAALLAKGGWTTYRLPSEVRIWRYAAREFHDEGPRPPLGT
jgi:uncharacterized protein